MLYYADTSALAKLVMAEPESAALRAWALSGGRELVSCDLARTELLRAVRRQGTEATLAARAVLDRLTLFAISTSSYEAAGLVLPLDLRSLDAIHLTAALGLGDRLAGIVTYDARLTEAARASGIAVVAPA
ncbi:MAG: type II toxin-antitoxin system VapC family toxin [Solirubrobacteraceae bacterium]|nr:type II toxin-antitoxin system VapC family toxin [Patulibacter sp.]